MFAIASGINSEQKLLLYESKVCRLCGDKNENGRPLFQSSDSNEQCETSQLINRYLPVVVHDDGVSPRWICPGCHIQLESTAQFFEMIFKGQRIITELLQQERQAQEAQQSASKLARVDDLGQLYDTLDQAKWNELFGKPDLEVTDRDNLLVPLELFELEDLLKQGDNQPEQPEAYVEQAAQQDDGNVAKHSEVKSEELPRHVAEELTGECQGAEKDWIVKSEMTKLNARVIGYIQNQNKTEIGSLVVMEGASKKKRTNTKFVCDICSKIFTHEFPYIKHRKSHSILFECSVCLVKFGSSVKLTVHQQETQHNGKGIVEGLPLASNEGDTEQSEPKGNAYACDNCEDTFPELTTVLKHEETVHAGENRSFVCSACGKEFREKYLLQKHQETHVEERPHGCGVCGAAFKTSSSLSKHTQSHAEKKRYQCTMCTQGFAYKTSLDLHLNWHNGVKPYECEFCSKRFSQRGNLKEHLRVHSGDKPFSCDVCPATFSTSSQHRLHRRRHTNDRPHGCELCSKTFVLLENYKTHMRRHRNEKPFACEECTRAFTERWALRKHIRTHTREKPYTCNYCAKPFSDSSNLMRHVTTIHEKQPKPKKKQGQPQTIVTEPSGIPDVKPIDGTLPELGVVIDETDTLVSLTEDEILTLDTTVYMADN
ncbi:hypothetical protein ZHAS_00011930 [Anopheles sinensis]|uniref:Uncharacterized protein n=1 Tax=Anopheles sinensis TaxID=74873 RepID=A0A084W1K1_ANOSI|nr:hypothetical protein ZHAS_00011930 [Anopheles sinensis]